jgi:hypothetical protein
MAEQTMLVCDTCGRPASETVTFKTSRGNRQRDYCPQHLDELLGPSRAPKRGRRAGTTAAGAVQVKAGTKSTRRTAKKSATRKGRLPNANPPVSST